MIVCVIVCAEGWGGLLGGEMNVRDRSIAHKSRKRPREGNEYHSFAFFPLSFARCRPSQHPSASAPAYAHTTVFSLLSPSSVY